MTSPFLIVISGPPAVGKNEIAASIKRHFPRTLATLDMDQIKELVETAPRTDPFLDLASRVAQSMTHTYLNARMSVLVHNAFCDYAYVQPFLKLAGELQVRSWYFKLTAPLEELIRRNRGRAVPCSESDLRRICAHDQRCSHSAGVSIDTLARDPDGSAKLILQAVSSKPTTVSDATRLE